jgi:hypothetical protein
MIKLFAAFVLINVAILGVAAAATTTKTEFGDCVGLDDDKNPELVYKTDLGNVVIGAFLVSTIVAPVYLALEAVSCPVGKVATPSVAQ